MIPQYYEFISQVETSIKFFLRSLKIMEDVEVKIHCNRNPTSLTECIEYDASLVITVSSRVSYLEELRQFLRIRLNSFEHANTYVLVGHYANEEYSEYVVTWVNNPSFNY